MSNERGSKSAFFSKIISKSEGEESPETGEDTSIPEEKHDVLVRLGISDSTMPGGDVLTPKKLSQVRFNETRPRGFSMKQVEQYHNAVMASTKSMFKIIEQRDRDVVRLATEIDKYIVDLKNKQNELDIYQAVGGVPLKNDDGSYLKKKDASEDDLRIVKLQQEKTELHRTIDSLKAKVGELTTLVESSNDADEVEQEMRRYKKQSDNAYLDIARLRNRVRELEIQLFGDSAYEIIPDPSSKIKRPSVDFYDAAEPGSDIIEGEESKQPQIPATGEFPSIPEEQTSDSDVVTLDRESYEREQEANDKWAREVEETFAKAQQDLSNALEEIAKRDATIEALNDAYEESEGNLASARRELDDKSGIMVSLENAVSSLQQEVSQRDAKIAEHEETIEELRDALAKRGEHVDRVEATARLLEAESAEKSNAIQSLSEDKDALARQITAIQSLLGGVTSPLLQTTPSTPPVVERSEDSTEVESGDVGHSEYNSLDETREEGRVDMVDDDHSALELPTGEDATELDEGKEYTPVVEVQEVSEPSHEEVQENAIDDQDSIEDVDDESFEATVDAVDDSRETQDAVLSPLDEGDNDDVDSTQNIDGDILSDDDWSWNDEGESEQVVVQKEQHDEPEFTHSDDRDSEPHDEIAVDFDSDESEVPEEAVVVSVLSDVPDNELDDNTFPENKEDADDDDDDYAEDMYGYDDEEPARPSVTFENEDDEEQYAESMEDDDDFFASPSSNINYEDEQYSDEIPSVSVPQSEESEENTFDVGMLYDDNGNLDESRIDPDTMDFHVDDDSRYDSSAGFGGLLTPEDFKEDTTVHVHNGRQLPPGIRPEDL